MDRVDIVNTTLGKAMGGATGGYTGETFSPFDVGDAECSMMTDG
jgi:hypothetical protein